MGPYPKATAPSTEETTLAANERADRWKKRALEARAERDALADAARSAAERALREAADELGMGVTYEGGYVDTVILPDTLRDRADQIAKR